MKSINVPYNYEEDNFNSLPISKAEYIGMPHASSEFIQISSSRIFHSNTREIKTPSFSKSGISHAFESESVINPSFDDEIEDSEIDNEDQNVPSGNKKKEVKRRSYCCNCHCCRGCCDYLCQKANCMFQKEG